MMPLEWELGVHARGRAVSTNAISTRPLLVFATQPIRDLQLSFNSLSTLEK